MRIHDDREKDAPAAGQLIARTYCEYNLSHADPDEPERLAWSL